MLVTDLAAACTLVPAGLLAGGVANYIASLLLRIDDIFFQQDSYNTCHHTISALEIIPFVSFFLPTKNCKYCLTRLYYEDPLIALFTAFTFIVLGWHFSINPYSIGLMIFSTVLIIVCITDFKAKIIPHEITYPSILLGIMFSARMRSDVIGALAGIGISYIVFDFLAFYGLQVYLWLNPPLRVLSQQFFFSSEKSVATSKQTRQLWFSNAASQLARTTGERSSNLVGRLVSKGTPIEQLEVIGGGDAVLAALISAWLGWQKLILAVAISFIVGAILGALYLVAELWKQRLLQTVVLPIIICTLMSVLLAASGLTMFNTLLKQPLAISSYLNMLLWAIPIGLLLGILIGGCKISKPFPFGPALVAGAAVAIFT